MATPTVTSIPSATSSQAAPSCTTAVPGKYGKVPLGSCNSYYSFDPSFEGNLAFAVLFGVSLIVHLVQAITFKKRFCWVIIVGAAWEAAGFILRTLGTRDQQQMGYSIAGQLLFLLAPLWINAFAYMLAARLVYYVLPDQKVFRIKARVLTKIFVAIDIVCFLVQAAGGLMMSNTEVAADDPIVRNGQRVYMIGCGLQLGFVVIFCILMGRFYFKMIRAQRFDLNMKRVKALVWVMYAVLLLIVVSFFFFLSLFSRPAVLPICPIWSCLGPSLKACGANV
nr:RTA1 domain-containing protein [Colletotrichum truncatum]KAF6788243.1 RTA1 domain-containing protein [Colletotrichum truncatum]